MKTLYLIRHGEAGDDRLGNVTYTPKNEYDKPLTHLGVSQAIKLEAVFKSTGFDRSYTSDYLRAIETFEHAGFQTQSHFVLSEVRELFCECIGMNFGNKDLAEFESQKQRVQTFLDEHVAKIQDGETVVVVAHGCLILRLLELMMGKSFGHAVTHTGITKLTFKDGWDFEFFNNSSHLYDPVDSDVLKVLG